MKTLYWCIMKHEGTATVNFTLTICEVKAIISWAMRGWAMIGLGYDRLEAVSTELLPRSTSCVTSLSKPLGILPWETRDTTIQ